MTPPSRSTRSGTRGYAHLIEISVPMDRVWRALTDPALIRIWSGQEAEVDARKGGRYRIGKLHAGGREAHIDIFDINRRLRLIYLNAPDDPPSASALVDDFLLDMRPDDRFTALRVLGSGVPEAAIWDTHYLRMRQSWERLLARIKVSLEAPPNLKKPPPAKPKEPPLPGLDY
jgi:uncharacterized protein YndB with AHSA1/START domain